MTMRPFPITLTEDQISSKHGRMPAREEIKLFLLLQRYLLPFWDKMALGIFMGIVGGYTAQLFVIYMKITIDVIIPQKDYFLYACITALIVLFGTFGAKGLFGILGDFSSELCKWYVNFYLHFHLRMMFFKHLHSLSMRFFNKRPTGEHIDRALGDTSASVAIIMDPIPKLITQLGTQSLIIFTALHYLSWWVVLVQYVYMFINWYLIHWSKTIERRMRHTMREYNQAVQAGTNDGLKGFMTVKAFGRQRTEVKRYVHLLGREIRQDFKLYWFGILMRHVNGDRLFGLAWFHGTIRTIILAILVITGQITLGTQGVIVLYMGYLTAPFQSFYDFFQDLRINMIPAERLRDTLSVAPSVQSPKRGIRLKPLAGHISFENVSFRYEDKLVLMDFSFDIPAGTRIGIVGPSGSGKSTLLSLLLRLYDPEKGKILIDGHDLRGLNLTDYHHQIGPVLQDTYLFQGSLRDNMLFAKANATDDEIMEALRRAEVADFVSQLPLGLGTDLGEGTRLSGGQKQRIGIARAMLRNPSMIVLDEPTSSLDIPTEHAIVKTLESVIENRTTFFVSHRLGLVSGCSMILVLDEGQLVAQGTHKELLAKCPLYAELWNEQYGEGQATDAGDQAV